MLMKEIGMQSLWGERRNARGGSSGLDSEDKRTELDRENPHPRTTSSNIEKLEKISELRQGADPDRAERPH